MIYALYHSEAETMGYLGDVLTEMGFPHRDVHLYRGDGLPRDTSHLQGLVVMGGPMNVDEVHRYPFLFEEVRLIEKMISESKPILGICLGAQLIAKALDARVYPNKQKEIGWHPITLTDNCVYDPVFQKSPKSLTVLHWHGETFDLPQGAVHLAKSARCAHQAFRWGQSVYGLQFHLEVTASMVRSWVQSEDGQRDIQEAGEDPVQISTTAPSHFQALKPAAHQIFTNYLTFAFPRTLTAR